MSKNAKIKISSQNDEYSEVHIAGSLADYATICGMDNNPSLATEDIVSEFVEDKVTCNFCIEIWKICRKIKPSEIDIID